MACIHILEEKYNGKIEEKFKTYIHDCVHYDLHAVMFMDNV